MATVADADETTPLISSTLKSSATHHPSLQRTRNSSKSTSRDGNPIAADSDSVSSHSNHKDDSLNECSSSAGTYYQAESDILDTSPCASPDVPTQSYWRLCFPENISMTLENHGSVARDHLALERTFLAYVRTSLALAGSGVALVQLFTVAAANAHIRPLHRLHHYIRPLGAASIVMGLVVLFMGVARYFAVQNALTKGNFPVSRLMTGFITLAMTVLVMLTFGILVAGKLELSKSP